ncbi:hypothetical protein ASC63_03100 [Leifsonia sp. Root112D2]|nr:hypothetical protein ASC63_03100 [Leifsonia sp. Root112D2]
MQEMSRFRSMKVTGAIMAVAVATVLAGCSSQPAPAPTDTGSGAASGPYASEVATAKKLIPELDADIVKKACDEKQLTLYTLIFRNDLNPLVQKFQDAFPCITIQKTALSGGASAERFATEARAGTVGADIWMNSSPAAADSYAKEGLLTSWTPPNVKRIIPAQFKDSKYWWSVGTVTIGIAWNKDAVGPAMDKKLSSITTWDQLAVAGLKGKSGMANVRAGGTTQLPYFYMEQRYGKSSLEKLDSTLQPTIFSGVAALSAQLASGAIAYAPLTGGGTLIADTWTAGAPVRWRSLEPGLAVPFFETIAKTAPHLNAAKLFVAWSLSQQGQQSWNSDVGLTPVNPAIKDLRTYAKESWFKEPSLKSYFVPDWTKINDDLPQLTSDFDSIFG